MLEPTKKDILYPKTKKPQEDGRRMQSLKSSPYPPGKVKSESVSHSVMSDSLWPYGLYSPSGSFVHRILQARILEWVAIPFCKRSSQPRDWTQVCIAGRFFTVRATKEVHSPGRWPTNWKIIILWRFSHRSECVPGPREKSSDLTHGSLVIEFLPAGIGGPSARKGGGFGSLQGRRHWQQ